MHYQNSRIIPISFSIKEALGRLNEHKENLTLFVINETGILKGSLTDGDIRRGILNGHELSESVSVCMQTKFRFLKKKDNNSEKMHEFRVRRINLVPVLDDDFRIINLLDLNLKKAVLPVDAVIMAGGRGERLRPLTDTTPKPLLKVGNKAIIQHSIDRLILFGVNTFFVSLRYMADQIQGKIRDGSDLGVSISYVREEKPLGTMGALSLMNNLSHDYVLLMNSDLLTNLDYEDFFNEFIQTGADVAVACIPYNVSIPYAVMETDQENIVAFKEKPTLTYFANAGIYLFKRELVQFIPKEEFFNATDFIQEMINKSKKVVNYTIRGYWLDIGQHEDLEKAQRDITHIKF